jgi:DNA-binding YbaB/EbfC family protein
VAKPDQMKMLRQLQQVQADMAAAQQALEEATVEATVGGGVVKAVVSGAGELRAISIDPSVVDPDDVETLEDLVLAAVTEGMRQARAMQAEKMAAAAGPMGGLDLGSIGNLLG